MSGKPVDNPILQSALVIVIGFVFIPVFKALGQTVDIAGPYAGTAHLLLYVPYLIIAAGAIILLSEVYQAVSGF